MTIRNFEDLAADFEFLDDWEDRYRYIIELGRELPPFPEEARTEANKVHGCVSQVWIVTSADNPGTPEAVLHFIGDSDAVIVRGLIAILISLVSGKTAREIINMDIAGELSRLGLQEHLTPQRSNGRASMIQRLKDEAQAVLSGRS